MDQSADQKVQTRHLNRRAYLYARQSSMRQILENSESTKRQYALRQWAIALGWASDQIIVIDDDQWESGALADGRGGFQRLVAEVGMGNAGIVMGLEVSRLARNSSDWRRLLEICALTDTLVLDEDGLYEPNRCPLQQNSAAHRFERRHSRPQGGVAHLQGLASCGRCGEQMTVRYQDDKGIPSPTFMCQCHGRECGEPSCPSIMGATLDAEIGKILVELEIALAVKDEISTHADDVDRLLHMEVEHMQYEADLARRRYMQIDPDNRLVADALEGEWNDRLRAVQAAREMYERHRNQACTEAPAEENASHVPGEGLPKSIPRSPRARASARGWSVY